MKPFRATARMTGIIWLCVLLVLQSGLAHRQTFLPHSAHANAALVVAELHYHHSNLPYLSQSLSDSLDNWLHSSCLVGASCCGFWVAEAEVLIRALSWENPCSVPLLLPVVLPIYDPPPKSFRA